MLSLKSECHGRSHPSSLWVQLGDAQVIKILCRNTRMPITRKEWPCLNPFADIAPQQEGAYDKEKGGNQSQHFGNTVGSQEVFSETEDQCSHHLYWRALSISFTTGDSNGQVR